MRLGAGQSSRHDLAILLNEILERIDILVIHLLNMRCREAAEFFTLEQRILLFALFFELEFVFIEFFAECHFWLLLICWGRSSAMLNSVPQYLKFPLYEI